MKLCLFARTEDPVADRTEAQARARGYDVLRVAFDALLSGVDARFDGDSWSWMMEPIEGCDAFVVRRYPAPHALLAPPETSATAKDWYVLGKRQLDRSSFAQSAIADVELRGKPVVNPLVASQAYDHKPLQLAVWRRAGLPIPRTRVTGAIAPARAFIAALHAEGREAVCKPVVGGAEVRRVDEALLARLDALVEAPAIFQERVEGLDVRVTVVGGRVVSSTAIESDAVDYRADARYRAGQPAYRPFPLSSAVAAMCAQAAALCGHVLSGIDLKVSAGGAPVLLEANAAPDYLDIEDVTGAPITAAILDWLEARHRAR